MSEAKEETAVRLEASIRMNNEQLAQIVSLRRQLQDAGYAESHTGIPKSFVEALQRAARQWASYYDSFGDHGDADYDLATAKHEEGSLYRWCLSELRYAESRICGTPGTPTTIAHLTSTIGLYQTEIARLREENAESCRACEEHVETIEAYRRQVKQLEGESEQARNLLLKFARHLRNTDEIPPLTWGVDGMDLLCECQKAIPKEYEEFVKTKKSKEPPR